MAFPHFSQHRLKQNFRRPIGVGLFENGIIRNIDSNIIKKSSEIFRYFKERKPVILRKTKKGNIKMLWDGKALSFSMVVEKNK